VNQLKDQSRIGLFSAISGVILLSVGTFLHPVPLNPNDAPTAFVEYAADQWWVLSHLMQWIGIVFLVGMFVLLTRRMANGSGADWAYLGMAGAIGILAVSSALQAVDGLALKILVDAWAAAPNNEKATLFQAAFGTRQIEIGLASIATILTGITVCVYGISLVVDRTRPKWLGLLGIIDGGLLMASGIATAYTGFSGTAMTLSMPSSTLLLAWVILLGFFI